MSYWQSRSTRLLLDDLKDADKIIVGLKGAYEEAERNLERDIDSLFSRFQKEQQIDSDSANMLLRGNAYKNWRMGIDEYMKEIKKLGKSPEARALQLELDTLAMRARITRLEAMQMNVVANMAKLARVQELKTEEHLANVFKRDYYTNLYEHYKNGTPKILKLMKEHNVKIPNERVMRVIRTPWSGHDFSSNIWRREFNVAYKIKGIVAQNISSGRSIDRLVKDITVELGRDYKYNAQRLIRTETAYVKGQADLESYKTVGADKYQYLAILDSNTSEFCHELDGKVFNIDDAVVGENYPPMHPFCRSTTVIYDPERIGARPPKNPQKPNAWLKGQGVRDVEINRNKGYNKNRSNLKNQNKTYTFKPAKNIEEANRFAIEELGIKNASYKGMHLEAANEWNRGLVDAFNQFPALKSNFGFVGDANERNEYIRRELKKYYYKYFTQPGFSVTKAELKTLIEMSVKKDLKFFTVDPFDLAQSLSNVGNFTIDLKDFAGITLNGIPTNDMAQYKSMLKKDVKNKFHPIGCDTVKSILDHEIGHQLDNLLDIRQIKEIQDIYDKSSKSQLSKGLSIYSWKNDNPNKYSEMIAEGWSEYCNNEKPRPIAKKIGDTIVELYNIRYGADKND